MRRKHRDLVQFLALVAFLVGLPIYLSYAGSSAATGTNLGLLPKAMMESKIQELKWAWTSDNATGAVTALGAINDIYGQVIAFHAVPDSNASIRPTDAYDVEIVDGDGGLVVAAGNLPQTSGATGNYGAVSSTVYLRGQTLKFSVANAGNSKKGVFYLYIEQK